MDALERTLRTVIAAIAVACALAAPTAHAAATANEVADLWWNASESGWGIQLSQQHETVFATMYVYGPDGSPDFYVAVLDPASAVAWSEGSSTARRGRGSAGRSIPQPSPRTSSAR